MAGTLPVKEIDYISVVVATHNRGDSLRATLAALGDQVVPQGLLWEILIVDNNSSDHTPAIVDEFARTARIAVRYCFEATPGKSHALNTAIARAAGDFLLFTDDDVLPSPSWVTSALQAVTQWGADVVGGRILLKWLVPPPAWLASNEPAQRNLGLMDFPESRVLTQPNLSQPAVWGGNMGFRRTVLQSLGGFNPEFGPVGTRYFMGEDTDIVERATENGWTVVYDPSLLVWHTVGPDRMRRAYFWAWEFKYGRFEATHLLNASTERIFGVPRWCYRAISTAAVRCLVTSLLLSDDALRYQRDFSRVLGKAWALTRWR